MAGKNSAEHVEHPDGSHSIGATVDGVFLPFVTLDNVQVADRVEALRSVQPDQPDEGSSGKGR